ncbi:substrate-binding periplasmic protein [Caldimonas tepidiphila]|uniref:substrate-binding periplasmic protein n=1 Tax=Caldimonas tepidiphila TaxID=2315841 RepID=UPI000E5B506B|nr:transporter substrate-binding domain-containing protein [Caldimonas tepidiphila]
MSDRPLNRRRVLQGLGALALGALAAPHAAAKELSALERVRQRGSLLVGVYNDMPPFHVAGKGIDVEFARALAASIGVGASLLPFNAGENMDDDLRNMVWRGHYLGWGPADVLLHVPVDRPLIQNNPKVSIFAPYYRERLAIARDLRQVPQLESMASLKGQKIAVPGLSLAGWLLIGADGGAWREQLVTRMADGTEAARALLRGEVGAAAGLASELESQIGRDERYAIEPLPLPRARDGWPVGLAVKREADDLAKALQEAVNGLQQSGKLGEIFAAGNVSWRRP